MKITIEIPDEVIEEEVKNRVIDEMAKRIIGESRTAEKYTYRHAIKDIVREVIKEDKDNLAKRAVEAAAVSIENRAVKKAMTKKLEDMLNEN